MHFHVHIWNLLLTINSALLALATVYLIYATGASIYYVTPRPLELGVTLVLILICIEIILAAIEEVAG